MHFRKSFCLFFLIALLLMVSCNLEQKINYLDLSSTAETEVPQRKWTFLIYMSADNSLEAAAMNDIYEMESSSLDVNQVSVVFLVDRSPAYDTSCGNWSGGRLYELKTGRQSSENSIISKQLECLELSLTREKETELDMSSKYTLSEILSFMCREYSAEHYGLIMWGHGSGWRSSVSDITKGFANDGTSGKSMKLTELREALEGGMGNQKLDIIGFDTCFGSEIEVFYELKDSAVYGIGSEGLVLDSGWNYKKLFDYFNGTDKTAENFCLCVEKQFEEQFSYLQDSGIGCFDLRKMDEVFCAFDDYAFCAAEKIENPELRDILINSIIADSGLYTAGNGGDDVYIDIECLGKITEKVLSDDGINNKFQIFQNVLGQCTIKVWTSLGERSGIGVYFATLGEGGLYFTTHPSEYIRNKTSNQNKFVLNSSGYVPQSNNCGSFLDKLFYTTQWREK